MPSFNIEQSIQPGLAGRAGLPAAVDPKPLVRISANPRLQDIIALLRGSEDVGFMVRGVREFEFGAKVKDVLALRRFPEQEAG